MGCAPGPGSRSPQALCSRASQPAVRHSQSSLERCQQRLSKLCRRSLDFREPQPFSLSPTDELLALVHDYNTLSVHSLASGEQTCIHTVSDARDLNDALTPAWSPDSCCVATALLSWDYRGVLVAVNTESRSAAEFEVR